MTNHSDIPSFCTTCGKKLDPAFTFCPFCGGERAVIPDASNPAAPAQPRPSTTAPKPAPAPAAKSHPAVEQFDRMFAELQQRRATARPPRFAHVTGWHYIILGAATSIILYLLYIFFSHMTQQVINQQPR